MGKSDAVQLRVITAPTQTKAGVVTESSTDVAHESMQIMLLGSDPLRPVETVKIAWRWEAVEP